MNQIQFTDTFTSIDYLSYTNLNLYLNSIEIEAPSVKTNHISVIGADGVLDLTESFGHIRYNNRTLSFEFTIDTLNVYNKMTLYQDVVDALHGKYMDICILEQPIYIYKGRVNVGVLKREKGIFSFTITCDCDPFKINTTPTIVSATVSDESTITLNNDKKPVVPIITSSNAMYYEFEGGMYYHASGVFSIPEIELKEGTNTIVVSGNGTVRFVYQKGRL